MNSEVTLELSEVVVCRGAQRLGPVSLKIQRGECSSLVGANGSGKSSILEAIAGFLQVESGTIRIGGKTISEEGTENEPWQRGIGWLGQQRGLWPHMTLREQAQLLSSQKTAGQLEDTAAALDLQSLLDRRPDQLSGGEAQRGELLRILCGSAPLLLLDEPFSAQNRQQRERILEVLHRELEAGRTILLAIHEALPDIEAIPLGVGSDC